MKSNLTVDFKQFDKRLDVAVDRILRGTKKATKAACEEILEGSLKQVPRDTNALADTAHYEIHGSYKNFSGTIGYGGNFDKVNPKTGERVSNYMIAVHEDLEAFHAVGKAKFLEDPVREFSQQFASKAARIIKSTLGG